MTWTLVLILSPLGSHIAAIWHSPETLTAISAKLDRLSAELTRATGEDRIIRQPPGLSYVAEPVHQGDVVRLYLGIERTARGAPCRLVDYTPIFIDATNIPQAGRRLREGAPQQVTDSGAQALRTDLQPPATLLPGRVTVHLALRYDCPGPPDRDGRPTAPATVPDHTDPVAFRLLPAE